MDGMQPTNFVSPNSSTSAIVAPQRKGVRSVVGNRMQVDRFNPGLLKAKLAQRMVDDLKLREQCYLRPIEGIFSVLNKPSQWLSQQEFKFPTFYAFEQSRERRRDFPKFLYRSGKAVVDKIW
jgi:hypothetical protein